MMTVLILLTIVDDATITSFDLYSDVDPLSPFYVEVPITSLVTSPGFTAIAPDSTTVIHVVAHDGICHSSIYLPLYSTTTTTSTTIYHSTTTTTTTLYGGDYTFYDTDRYMCTEDKTCLPAGTLKIANYPVGAMVNVGKFYSYVDGDIVYVVKILGLSVPQTGSGYITNINSAGTLSCSDHCGNPV